MAMFQRNQLNPSRSQAARVITDGTGNISLDGRSAGIASVALTTDGSDGLFTLTFAGSQTNGYAVSVSGQEGADVALGRLETEAPDSAEILVTTLAGVAVDLAAVVTSIDVILTPFSV
jgi:hypothetical protein